MLSGRTQTLPVALESYHRQQQQLQQKSIQGSVKQKTSPRLPEPVAKRASASPVSRSYSPQKKMPARKNQYFLPGEGIRREVITADICRYLGNDALVKPGHMEGRDGFWVTAYRALTSDMIADLKADSARWEMESAQVDPRNVAAGTSSSAHPSYRTAGLTQSSVPYRDSRTHEYRQQYGPSSAQTRQVPPPQVNPQDYMDRSGGHPHAAAYDYYNQSLPQTGYVTGAYQGGYAAQDYQNPNPDPNYPFMPGANYQPAAAQPRTVPSYTSSYVGTPSEGPYSTGHETQQYSAHPGHSGHPSHATAPSTSSASSAGLARGTQQHPQSSHPSGREPYGRGGAYHS
ncbi:MAG: hypothetical protein M1816_006595 [Peltula sp. TS41687]|nr:MAG: hypothetical protein M1816_006595 [Peltula sp. TS41687]